MGCLRDFKLDEYGCEVYVETGTGICTTLSKAVPYFNKCYSVDSDPKMVQSGIEKFPMAHIVEGLSVNVLEKWLQHDLAGISSVLFFLDAHFPGSDFYGIPHDVNSPNAVPLKEELTLIKQYRPNSKDFIICDDARIYTSGPFQNGSTDWFQVPGGYQFVYDLFPDAKISLTYEEEGYIIIDKRNI